MRVLYEDNHIIVVVKPHNVPSQEDSSRDADMLSMVKAYVKERYNKPGNVFIGLVHRLDRPTSGIMVFARTSKAAQRLSKQFANHEVIKKYTALVTGKPAPEGEFTDYLKKDEKTNTVKVASDGKLAKLSYETLADEGKYTRVSIMLYTGRSHQIRVQFASRGYALKGDAKYGKGGCSLCLCCTYLAFNHPTTKERLTFTVKEDF